MGLEYTGKFILQHLNDSRKIYHHIYWINVLTGVYPRTFRTKFSNRLFLLYRTILALAYSLTAVCFIIDAYIVRNDLERLSFNLTTSVLLCVTLLKITMVAKRRRNFDEVLVDLHNNLHIKPVANNPTYRAVFSQKEMIIMIFARYFYLSLLFIYILRILAEYISETKYYLIPVPFKEELDDYYEVIYIHHIFISIHFITTVVSHDLLVYGVVIRLIAHFEILIRLIEEIKTLYPKIDFEKYVPEYKEVEEEKGTINDVLLRNESDLKKSFSFYEMYGFHRLKVVKESRSGYEMHKRNVRDEITDRNLRSWISYHHKLLEAVEKFCNVYSKPLLVQAFGSAVLSGIVALHALFLPAELTPMLVQQVLYVITTLMNILYICTLGTDITEKSIQAANTFYNIPWYQMSIQNQKTLMFCIKRLQKGPKLRGGGMVVFNRITYLKFLQSSYNIVALLKNS